jgi:hypothetical protein
MRISRQAQTEGPGEQGGDGILGPQGEEMIGGWRKLQRQGVRSFLICTHGLILLRRSNQEMKGATYRTNGRGPKWV